MTYCCEDCGFLFLRLGQVQTCPLCEGYHFRPATPEETERLLVQLGEKEEPGIERV